MDRVTDRDLASACSLPRWLQQLGLTQEPGILPWSPTGVMGTQASKQSFIAFPDALVGRWIGSRTVRTWTGTPI